MSDSTSTMKPSGGAENSIAQAASKSYWHLSRSLATQTGMTMSG